MENPSNGGGGGDGGGAGEDKDGAARPKMPAERMVPGHSVTNGEAARFLTPAQNPDHRVEIESELEENMDENDEDQDESREYDQPIMKNIITVECQKLNGKTFHGTVNYSEAKNKIFQDGLGLDPGLLDCVKITYNNVKF